VYLDIDGYIEIGIQVLLIDRGVQQGSIPGMLENSFSIPGILNPC
jgi:hypothetical protein